MGATISSSHPRVTTSKKAVKTEAGGIVDEDSHDDKGFSHIRHDGVFWLVDRGRE